MTWANNIHEESREEIDPTAFHRLLPNAALDRRGSVGSGQAWSMSDACPIS